MIPCHVRSMVVHMRLYSLRGDNVVPSSLPKCHVVVIIQPPIKLSSTTSIYGVKVKIYKGCRRNTLYESKLLQHTLRTMPLNNIKKKKVVTSFAKYPDQLNKCLKATLVYHLCKAAIIPDIFKS